MSIYKKEEWTADEIRENIAALFGNDEIRQDTIINLLAQTDSTECVIEGEGMDM